MVPFSFYFKCSRWDRFSKLKPFITSVLAQNLYPLGCCSVHLSSDWFIVPAKVKSQTAPSCSRQAVKPSGLCDRSPTSLCTKGSWTFSSLTSAATPSDSCLRMSQPLLVGQGQGAACSYVGNRGRDSFQKAPSYGPAGGWSVTPLQLLERATVNWQED